MNSVHFRTIRDRTGLSALRFAELLGVHMNLVYRYSELDRTEPVPEHIARAARDIEARFDQAVNTAIDRAEGVAHIRYRTDEEFDAKFPTLAGWGQTAQGRLLGEARATTGLPIAAGPLGAPRVSDTAALQRLRDLADGWRDTSERTRQGLRLRPLVVTPVLFDLGRERLPEPYPTLLDEMRRERALLVDENPRALHRRMERPVRYVNRHERRKRGR